jgi:endonuclease/exonuclease/phosphatase family metal-dependent hydrolase
MVISGMTYNLKNPVDRDANAWPTRRPLIAELLTKAGPQVIGTQEGHYSQLRDIVADTGRYEWIGMGREGGGRGEFCAVLYDPAVLTPVDQDHFWLSDTPDVIASVTPAWGNQVIRMATWVRFRLTDGAELIWLNTHLDHRSEVARQRGAALIVERVAGFPAGVPLVVAGDFNCPPGSPTYRILTGAGLADAWTAAGRPEIGTYGGWQAPGPDSDRIDWILTRGPITVASATICDFHVDDRWPSDHVPVQCELHVA